MRLHGYSKKLSEIYGFFEVGHLNSRRLTRSAVVCGYENAGPAFADWPRSYE
jgi:hypothetical protein